MDLNHRPSEEVLSYTALAMCIGGLFLLGESRGNGLLGLLLMLGSIALVVLGGLARRGTTWSLTSDRLIERRDLFASSHQEMELIDVRSIELRSLVHCYNDCSVSAPSPSRPRRAQNF